MNSRFLETFIWIARLGSFSTAAEKLFTTQQGASARIAVLERELGVRLFQRDMRDVRLTAEGQFVLERAEIIVRNIAELKAGIGDPTTLRGAIRIGVIDTISCTWLPDLLVNLNQTFPMISFAVRADTSSNLGHELMEGKIDLAFLMGPLQKPGVSTIELCTYGCSWVASPKLQLSNRPLSLEDISRFRLLSFPDDSGPHAAMINRAREQTGWSSGIFTSNSLLTIIRLAVEGQGVAALPESVIEKQISDGLLDRLVVTPAFPPLAVHAAWLDDPGNVFPATIASMAASTAASFARTRDRTVCAA